MVELLSQQFQSAVVAIAEESSHDNASSSKKDQAAALGGNSKASPERLTKQNSVKFLSQRFQSASEVKTIVDKESLVL